MQLKRSITCRAMKTPRRASWALALALPLLSASCAKQVQAQSCDCTQTIGTCNASIQVTPTGSRKGLYGADLLIRADAPACAKVEYFVDGTPAFTILANGRQDSDRVMGTGEKRTRKGDIVLDACHVCKTADQAAADRAKEERQRAEAEARAQQQEVERLVAEGNASGSLQPRSQSGSGGTTMDSVMQLQSQLQSMQQSGTRAAFDAGTNSRSTYDPCTVSKCSDFGTPNPGPGASRMTSAMAIHTPVTKSDIDSKPAAPVASPKVGCWGGKNFTQWVRCK